MHVPVHCAEGLQSEFKLGTFIKLVKMKFK